VEGAGVVAFESEAVFEGPEDRLDALADRCEVRSRVGFVFASGTQDQRAEAFGDRCFEGFAGVAAAFVIIFLAPVDVPLKLLTGWIHTVASVNSATVAPAAVRAG
jgi:hypothetical protein